MTETAIETRRRTSIARRQRGDLDRAPLPPVSPRHYGHGRLSARPARRAGRRTRTRRCRCSSAASRSATCSTSCSASAAARRSTSCSRGSSPTPAAASGRCASLGALRRREHPRDRDPRQAPRRARAGARRDRARRRQLGAALPRHLRADVQPVPVPLDALVPRAAPRARPRRRRAWVPLGGRDAAGDRARTRTARSCSARRGSTCLSRARRIRQAIPAFAAVLVLAIPLWRAQPRPREPLRRRRRRRRRQAEHAREVFALPLARRRRLLDGLRRARSSVVLVFAVLGLAAPAPSTGPEAALLTACVAAHPDAVLPRRPLRRQLGARVAAPDLRAAVPRARDRASGILLALSPRRAGSPAARRRRDPARSRSPGAGTRRRRCSSARTRSASTRAPRGRLARARRPAPTTSSSPTSRSTSPPGSANRSASRAPSSPAPTRSSRSRRSTTRRSRSAAASSSSTPATTTTTSSGRRSSYGSRSRAPSSRAASTARTSSSARRTPTRHDRPLPRRRAQGRADRQVARDGRRRHQLRDDPPAQARLVVRSRSSVSS